MARDTQAEPSGLAALAKRVASGSSLSARFHKAAIRKLRGALPITQDEHVAVNGFVETEDFHNAVRAFLEKRRPVWKAR